MSKLVGLACAALFLLLAAMPQNDRFLKYKTVEAYEIRPGILIMPRYSEDGQVCEIGLERRHYSPEVIRLDSGLTREEIDQIFEEIVPADERGAKSKDFGRELSALDGISLTTNVEYENVSIQFYSSISSTRKKVEVVAENVAVTVHWKSRKCQ